MIYYIRRISKAMPQQQVLTIESLNNLLAINSEIAIANERGCLQLLPKYPDVLFSRVGHLLCEVDYIVKKDRLDREALRLGPSNGLIARVLYDPRTICNRAIFEIFPREVQFVECAFPFLLRQQIVNSGLDLPISDVVVAMYKQAMYIPQQAAWGDREPVVQIPNEWKQKGEEALAALGLPPNTQYVCIHARTGGYSPGDENCHYMRNTDIQDYVPSINYLREQGLWVIRMGNETMPRLQDQPMVIDYAHYPLKSDWLDLYLAANCLFFISDSSGCGIMGSVFQRPIAFVNGALPFNYAFLGNKCIGMPKLIRNKETGRLIKFSDIFKSKLCHFRLSDEIINAGVELVSNSPDEIYELVKELHESLLGRLVYTPNDNKRQDVIKSMIPPDHYASGAAARCGRYFLHKYEHLLL